MDSNETTVTDARINMSTLIRLANNSGTITYLTSNGLRVAAIVPAAVADAALSPHRNAA